MERARALVASLTADEPDTLGAGHVADVRELEARGPDGVSPIPLRIYRPVIDDQLPVLMYFHGGGFVLGSLDSADTMCRRLANLICATVVSVDYRLAPEHPAPAAIEDCYAATTWVADNGEAVRGNPLRLGLWGDDAGGGLACSVGLLARDRGGPRIAVQASICPITDLRSGHRPNAHNQERELPLSREDVRWFLDQYLAQGDSADVPYLSPLQADLTGLPPSAVVTAGFDPFRVEGDSYATALEEAGVDVLHVRIASRISGSFLDPKVSTALSTEAVWAVSRFVRRYFWA